MWRHSFSTYSCQRMLNAEMKKAALSCGCNFPNPTLLLVSESNCKASRVAGVRSSPWFHTRGLSLWRPLPLLTTGNHRAIADPLPIGLSVHGGPLSRLALRWLCRQSPEREAEPSAHRAAGPTPEMLTSAHVSAGRPLQPHRSRHGGPSGQGRRLTAAAEV